MELVCKELKNQLPESVKFRQPQGGFFIWLELPEQINSAELLRFAVEQHKVNFIFGQR